MSEIILHHYPQSPVSEKVRVVLGIKGLSWQSVIIPRVPPKPKLTPLTGGFRLTPVMQIGADIYCDSMCIIRELENRFPEPTILSSASPGLDWGLSSWTDGDMFTAMISVVFSDGLDHMPEGFAQDRIALYFDATGTSAEFVDMLPRNLAKIRSMFGSLEDQLGDQEYLHGSQPTLADALSYYLVWFLRGRYSGGADVIGAFPTLTAWEDRVRAIGHGAVTDLSDDDALEVAREATPDAGIGVDPDDPLGFSVGDTVGVRAENDQNITVGKLITLQRNRVTVVREEESLGEVAVHFPRVGYCVGRM